MHGESSVHLTRLRKSLCNCCAIAASQPVKLLLLNPQQLQCLESSSWLQLPENIGQRVSSWHCTSQELEMCSDVSMSLFNRTMHFFNLL
jgi:hypothetical protein